MNRRARSAAAVFILSLISFACGGGGGGGGPTDPPAPSGKRFQFTVVAAPGNFEGGILEGAIFFDDREVGRTDWSRAGGPCEFPCEVLGDVQGIPPGSHVVRFTVVRQERALMFYQIILSGFVIDPVSGSRTQINRVSDRVRLRAGESVNFTVTI
ncbi:MAG: hypothetical protein ABJC13_07600 [Acidobacteriota bacterium]